MNTKFILISCFIIASTFNSCSNSTQVEDLADVRFQSEQEVFSSSESVEILLFNDTDEELYLYHCGPVLLGSLDIKVNEEWINYEGGARNYSFFCLWIYIPTFIPALEPGETRELTFDSLDVGEFRYSLPYQLSSVESDTLEVSFEFLVR